MTISFLRVFKPSLLVLCLASSLPLASSTQARSDDCGEVSVFLRPPETRDLYVAYINQVNGKTIVRGQEKVRLPVGKHVINVHEAILEPTLVRKSGIQRAKTIEINIEPNTRYHLAAKLDRDKRLSKIEEDYWQPVVWKTTERTCSL